MSQAQQIYKYMKEVGGITSLEAIRELGCTRLAARISDLEDMLVEQGDNERIHRESVKVPTRTGITTVTRYSLVQNKREQMSLF